MAFDPESVEVGEQESLAAEVDEIPLEERFPEGATCQNCLHDEYAIAYCHDCKRLLCEDCLAFHRRQVDTHRHHTVDSPKAEELKQHYRCQHHGDKMLDYFCRDCCKPICQHCQVTVCQGHNLMVAADIKDTVANLLERVKAKKERFSHHAEYIRAKMLQNADELNRCESEINTTFDTLIQELETKRANLITQLHHETGKNDTRVKEQMEYVSRKMEEMERSIAQTETLLSTNTDAKMTVKNMELCANLDGQASEWSRSVATFRSWQLDHKDPKNLTSCFGTLLPKPSRESIRVSNHEKAYVGISNTFTITVDISDQFEAYDRNVVDSFASVELRLTPTNDPGNHTQISYNKTRVKNVWKVSYTPPRPGRMSIEVSVCGVKAWEEPFTLVTAKEKKRAMVGATGSSVQSKAVVSLQYIHD